MAKFKFKVTTDVSGFFTAKVKGAVTDADVGKPVKLSTDTSDTYELCADGDLPEAWIVGVDPASADGLKLCTLNGSGRVRVQASGAMAVGDVVAAGVNAAAGTANANKLGIVKTYAVLGTELILWRVISANTTDGTVADGDPTVIIEKC